MTLKERAPKKENGVDALHNVCVRNYLVVTSCMNDCHYYYHVKKLHISVFFLIFIVDWCGDPPEVQGVDMTIMGHRSGSIVTYSCQQGFVAVGGQQVSAINIDSFETFLCLFYTSKLSIRLFNNVGIEMWTGRRMVWKTVSL